VLVYKIKRINNNDVHVQLESNTNRFNLKLKHYFWSMNWNPESVIQIKNDLMYV